MKPNMIEESLSYQCLQQLKRPQSERFGRVAKLPSLLKSVPVLALKVQQGILVFLDGYKKFGEKTENSLDTPRNMGWKQHRF